MRSCKTVPHQVEIILVSHAVPWLHHLPSQRSLPSLPPPLAPTPTDAFSAAGASAGVQVHPDSVAISVQLPAGSAAAAGGSQVTSRLLIDCMGHASPVVRQVRWGRKPDGVCLVVGTLGTGFSDNSTADVIYTNTDLQPLEGSGTTRWGPARGVVWVEVKGGADGGRWLLLACLHLQSPCHVPSPAALLPAAPCAMPMSCTSCQLCTAHSQPVPPPRQAAVLLGGVPSWQRPQRPHQLHVHIHGRATLEALAGAAV